MTAPSQTTEPLAQTLGAFAAACRADDLPPEIGAMVRRLVVDVAGLCIAARDTDYVAAALASCGGSGRASVIGHGASLGAYDAALVNGTAAHGEDFDDTFEGGPIHAGAVIVPAVLAVAEENGLTGADIVPAIALGVELMCRASTVAPQAIHKAGFHPTAVIGALGAALAVGRLLRLDGDGIARALGIAGSLASGIIEYLADGSWTKRLHAGAAANAGIRAARLAKGGFAGPKTVFEGSHGFYKAFAPSKQPDFSQLTAELGTRWVGASLAFKPYACGTMTQPFVDCAIALARSGVGADDIEAITCKVGEGTVHRLWEPLALKRRPPNAYAAKFSTPYCIAVGFLDGDAGLAAFTEERVADPALLRLAGKVAYVVDPDDPYPRAFVGHVRAVMKDGSVKELRQPHMRGGAHEPLSDTDLVAKYRANCRFGGWSDGASDAMLRAIDQLVAGGPVAIPGAAA